MPAAKYHLKKESMRLIQYWVPKGYPLSSDDVRYIIDNYVNMMKAIAGGKTAMNKYYDLFPRMKELGTKLLEAKS